MNSSKSKGVGAPLCSPATSAFRSASIFVFFGKAASAYLRMHEYQNAAATGTPAVHCPAKMVVP
jgi:hypothetical protein